MKVQKLEDMKILLENSHLCKHKFSRPVVYRVLKEDEVEQKLLQSVLVLLSDYSSMLFFVGFLFIFFFFALSSLNSLLPWVSNNFLIKWSFKDKMPVFQCQNFSRESTACSWSLSWQRLVRRFAAVTLLFFNWKGSSAYKFHLFMYLITKKEEVIHTTREDDDGAMEMIIVLKITWICLPLWWYHFSACLIKHFVQRH